VSLVLLVDDDAATVNLMRLTLQLSGYEVATVASRDAALALVQEQAPAVMVMDYLMPGMDAASFLAKVRAGGYEGRVVLCTGVDGATGLEVDALLRKPFEPDRLTQTIDSLVSPSL
jgi:CheY-like chemotaxis protein